MESIPRAETVTIDLTIDDSPAREKSELHKTSADLVRSEADIQMKFRTPDQSDCIAIEEPAFVPSPRHRRRSVTFASPIEYVLDKRVKSKTQVSSSRLVPSSFLARTRGQYETSFPPISTTHWQSRRPPSPSDSNTLPPLRITTGAVNMRRESPDRVTPRVTLQKSKLLQGDHCSYGILRQ